MQIPINVSHMAPSMVSQRKLTPNTNYPLGIISPIFSRVYQQTVLIEFSKGLLEGLSD